MPGGIRVTFAASAVADLEKILEYYTDQQVRDEGERIVGEILSEIESLRSHPDRGRIVPEFGLKNLRELIHPPFRIVYRRDPGADRSVFTRVVLSPFASRILRVDPFSSKSPPRSGGRSFFSLPLPSPARQGRARGKTPRRLR